MPVFFIVHVEIPDHRERGSYDEYIAKVKPVVESHGGKYIIRSEHVSLWAGTHKPDRIIVIEFGNKEQMEKCFSSPEYTSVKGLRENSVKTNAFIVVP
ncbi:MAG: DUF1330 domain-containing protein [Bacteroidales bacterium]|jgi:uncharacterized protein (DUF1330 family)|nr:DUF1330 domain-containing protein [Bacteroidales bacterium]